MYTNIEDSLEIDQQPHRKVGKRFEEFIKKELQLALTYMKTSKVAHNKRYAN